MIDLNIAIGAGWVGFFAGLLLRWLCVNYERRTPFVGMIPFAGAVLTGLGVMALLAGLDKGTGDRFHDTASCWRIAAALAGGLVLRVFLAALRPTGTKRPGLWLVTEFAVDVAGAIAVVGAGVRFSILAAGPGSVVGLGGWGAPLTVAFLVAATWAVRLLDGLDGVAPAMVLFGSGAIGLSAAINGEPVLFCLSMIVVFALFSCLTAHLPPARLPARGAATSMFGFFFAVLTVMARQKSVVAGVVILPLVLAVLAVAAVMLGALERNLFGAEDAQRGGAEKEARKELP